MTIAAVILGGAVGGGVFYVLLANRRIKGYQSKLRWVPALIAGGRIGELLLVLGVTVAGVALGSVFGRAMIAALDAQAR